MVNSPLPTTAQPPPPPPPPPRDSNPPANFVARPTAASSWSSVARSSSDALPRPPLEIKPISLSHPKLNPNGAAAHAAVAPTQKRSRWDVEHSRPPISIEITPSAKQRTSLSLPTPPAQSPSISPNAFVSTFKPVQPEPTKKLEPEAADWWKVKGTKDYKVVYDPLTDAGPVKKGKELIYRYDGEGLRDKVVDPRLSKSSSKSSKTRTLLVDSVAVLTYAWDKHSTGAKPPPPPAAILVTGFPGSTTTDQIHRHFASYGRIENQDVKTDSSTGGSLGICWIRFVDDVPRQTEVDRASREKYDRERRNGKAQDGNIVAVNAVAKANGSKIGPRMMMEPGGVKVELDGDGSKAKKAVAGEMLKRHPPPASKSTSNGPIARMPPGLPTFAPPRLPPVLNSSGARINLALPARPPPVPSRSPSSHLDNRSYPSDDRSRSSDSRSHPSDRNYSPPPPPPPPRHSPPPPPPPPRDPPSTAPQGPRSMKRFSDLPSSSYPSNQSHAIASTSTALPPTKSGGYKGAVAGAPTAMAMAVAAAVQQAKKRFESKQAKAASRSTRDNQEEEGEKDMELDSSGHEDSSEEEEKEEKVYFHRDSQRRNHEQQQQQQQRSGGRGYGIVPAAGMGVSWQASPVALRENLAANGHSHIFISKTTYYEDRRTRFAGNVPVLNGEELRRHFEEFELDQVYADTAGWYLTFKSSRVAALAYETLDRKRFVGASLALALLDPPSRVSSSSSTKTAAQEIAAMAVARLAASQKKSGWTDEELVERAKDIVIRDLMESFRNDLKTRVVAGKVLEIVMAWEKDSKSANKSTTTIGSATHSTISTTTTMEPKSLKDLPSFARTKLSHYNENYPKPTPRHHRLSSEAQSDPRATPSYDSRSRSVESIETKPTRKHQTEKIRRQVDSESEEDGHDSFIAKHKSTKKDHQRISARFTSSEGESEPEEEILEEIDHEYEELQRKKAAALEKRTAAAARKKVGKAKKRGKAVGSKAGAVQRVKVVSDEEEAVETEDERVKQEDEEMIDINSIDTPVVESPRRPTPHAQLSNPLFANLPSLIPDYPAESEYDSDAAPLRLPSLPPLPPRIVLQDGPPLDPIELGVAEDEEDLFYLKLAIERPRIGLPLHPTLPYADEYYFRHSTGSARTEGYYSVSVAEKLANRLPADKLTFEAPSGAVSGVAVSRLARANTRVLVRGMELHKKFIATDTDVLKFNQLRTRKKQLSFSRSGIHDYGLFALEHIPVGEMVIEYVGELVRQQVADRREQAYERQGIGSSYLFRVDEDLVVDATKKGNLGRLINHCCAPNCNARIITIMGEKKIVIYAKTNIEAGDEVTYDYHFPHEEVKIPCLCGHALCRKYLN